jgi:hypothetical protein
MTPEEPLDDDMFINANFPANHGIEATTASSSVTNRNATSRVAWRTRESNSHRCRFQKRNPVRMH